MAAAAAVVVVVIMMGGVPSEGREQDPPCNPDPDCTGKVLGDKVHDPKNCTNFYLCLDNGQVTDHPVPCDTGNEFPVGGTQCVPEDPSAPCSPACPDGAGSGECHLSCDGGLDFVSDPTDCSKYFMCIPGGVHALSCPDEHPYFNGKECGNDKDTCCVPGCFAICETPNTLIPDPKDCQRFYYCEEVGEAEENYHFSCADNENFNIQTAECSVEASCTVLCNYQ